MEKQGDRLKAARERAGFRSARSAALDMGVPVSTYNSHERAGAPGARNFEADDAKKYGRRFGVSYIWLLTGEGEGGVGVPLISWVSAGRLVTGDTVEDLASVPRVQASDLPKGDWFALRVDGDSMDRISPPESIIFVNRRDKRLIPNACYVIADADGGATYKRYRPGPPRRFEPVSVNPSHDPIFLDDDHVPVILGRVRRTVLDM
jgi:SOS-response transcriptional repressor LexA